MKITKNQLKRIIKEEKQKLLNEMNPLANANRMLANGIPEAMQDQLTVLLAQMSQKAELDLIDQGDVDEEDADVEGSNAVMMALANSLQSIGFTNAYDAMIMAINRAQR